MKMNMNLGVRNFFFIILIFFHSSSVISKTIEGDLAKIQILDKITAKVNTFDIKVDTYFKFQTIEIQIYACHKKPPEEIPENFVLLKIYDSSDEEKVELIYQGWMISSSPSTTPLEHPIYDVWLQDCLI